jgi:hypothetical protein
MLNYSSNMSKFVYFINEKYLCCLSTILLVALCILEFKINEKVEGV